MSDKGPLWCAVTRRHFSAGANPARQLSLQPVAVGADDGGNDIVRSTPMDGRDRARNGRSDVRNPAVPRRVGSGRGCGGHPMKVFMGRVTGIGIATGVLVAAGLGQFFGVVLVALAIMRVHARHSCRRPLADTDAEFTPAQADAITTAVPLAAEHQ